MEEIKRVQLSEVAELITKGTTPTTIGFEFQEQGVNFLKIECFDENGGFIKSKVGHISEECNEKLKRSQLKEGDLLFSIAGAIGRVAIVTKEMLPANTNQALAIIRIVNEQIYLPYIRLILTSPIVIEQFERKKQGVAQLNLSLKDINEISIPLPSKEKQIELADLFKKVVNIIYKKKEELLALDDLVRGRFVELFGDPELNPMGWEKVTLNDVCSSIVRGPFGSALKKEFFVEPSETTYKVYEQKHAIQKSASIGTYYITQEKYRELKRFECLPGDILMSCSGTMGELYQLPEGCEKGVINQALCKFTLNDKILPVCFLVYMQQTIGKLETKGSGIQNIAAVSYIKQMPINLPPMEVQKKFERFVNQINKSKFRGFSMLTTMKSAYEQQTLIYP